MGQHSFTVYKFNPFHRLKKVNIICGNEYTVYEMKTTVCDNDVVKYEKQTIYLNIKRSEASDNGKVK